MAESLSSNFENVKVFLEDRLKKFIPLTMEVLDEPCSDQSRLASIATKFMTWETTSVYLGIEEHELDEIKSDCNKTQMKKRGVLEKWVEKSGLDATYLGLIAALYKDQNIEMIDEVLRILQQEAIEYESGLDVDSVSSEASDALTNEDVSFLCGCQEKCSLEKFLTDGCPCPMENKEYPLLNIKKICKSSKHKANLIARLEEDAQSIRRDFAKLTISIIGALRKKCNESSESLLVEDLQVFVISLQPFRYMTPQEEHFKEEILKSKTVGTFMATLLSNFVSWFNHSLLSYITEQFNVCVHEYEQYVSMKLQEFLKKSLFEIPRNSFGEPKRSGQFILKIDVPPPKSGVQASILPLLKSHVAKTLGITASSFNLCTYEKGCIEIVVGAPALLLEATFPLDEMQLADIGNFQSNMKILSIIYNQNKCDLDSSSQPQMQEIQDPVVSLTDVEKQFSNLVVKVAKVPFQKVKNALDKLSTHTMTATESESFFTNDIHAIINASSSLELVLALSSYWSLVNFELLKYLLPSVSKIAEYSSCLSSLKIAHLPALLHPVDLIPPFSNVPVVVKMMPQYIQDKTVDDLLCLKKALAETLDLEPQSVLLKALDRHKQELLIHLPINATKDLLSFESTRFCQLSEQYSVLQIVFENATIFPKVTVKKSAIENFGDEQPESINSTCMSLLNDQDTAEIPSRSIEDEIGTFKDKLIEYTQATFTSIDQKASATTDHETSLKAGSTKTNTKSRAVRPMPKVAFRGKFVLCWNRQNCKKEDCTFAHTIEERDAWNKEKFQNQRRGSNAIALERSTYTSTNFTYITDSKVGMKNESPSISTQVVPQDSKYNGVLLICETCYLMGYSMRELASKVCVKPFQHNFPYTQQFHAAWDHKTNTLKSINPRPRNNKNGEFSLCEKGNLCNKEQCLKPHSEYERDAWNYDLHRVVQAQLIHDDEATVPPLNESSVQVPKVKQSVGVAVQRRDWYRNYKTRLEKSLARNGRVNTKLTSMNYREQFNFSICAEEQKHMDLLAEKCDKEYHFKFGQPISGQDKISGYIEGMTQDELHYATQASSGVYFVDSKTKGYICKCDISMTNFQSFEKDFEIEIHMNDVNKLKWLLKKENGEYIADLEFDLKHSYFETLLRAVSNLPASGLSKILLQPKNDEKEEAIRIQSTCSLEKLNIDEGYQLEALRGIMQLPSTLPVVVSGPFGSGKTRVLARAVYETIQRSFKHNKRTRILVCAHHFDTIKAYSEDYFIPAFRAQIEQRKIAIIRIGRRQFDVFNRSRSMFVQTMSAFDFRQYVNNGFYNQPQCVIVIATYMSSINIGESLLNRQHHFTHVFLDEAAQTREPEAISSLSATNADTKIVIAGDSKQVGPYVVVLIEDEILKTSILERLEKAYMVDLNLRKWHFKLGKNYRCHPVVTQFLSGVMYDSPVGVTENPDHTLVTYPLVFHCFDSKKSSATCIDQELKEEANEVIEQATIYLRQHNHIKCKNCCIISSNRSQLNFIKMKLRKPTHISIKDIKLLTSFLIQGYEFDAVFVCTSEYKNESGLISNQTKSLVTPRIFNTVLSRSKSLVVAVGNPFMLLESEKTMAEQRSCWKEFIKRCLSKNPGYLMTFKNVKTSRRIEIEKSLAEEIGIALEEEETTHHESRQKGSLTPKHPAYGGNFAHPPRATVTTEHKYDRMPTVADNQPSRSHSDQTSGYHSTEGRFWQSNKSSSQKEYTRHRNYH